MGGGAGRARSVSPNERTSGYGEILPALCVKVVRVLPRGESRLPSHGSAPCQFATSESFFSLSLLALLPFVLLPLPTFSVSYSTIPRDLHRLEFQGHHGAKGVVEGV